MIKTSLVRKSRNGVTCAENVTITQIFGKGFSPSLSDKQNCSDKNVVNSMQNSCQHNTRLPVAHCVACLSETHNVKESKYRGEGRSC